MFSKGNVIYGIWLVISASFTFQIYKFFEILLGKEKLASLIYVCLTLVLIFILICGIKIVPNVFQIFFILSGLLLSLSLIIFLPYIGEKTHILSYGLLGYLSIKDVTLKIQSIFKSLLFSLSYTLLINILDESFQWLLPYRVGEIRDVMINILCTFVGVLLFFGFNKKRPQRTA